MHERSIFMEALGLSDPLVRQAYLLRACGGDDQLRIRVEALLHSHRTAEGFMLDRLPPVDFPVATDPALHPESCGTTIGPYRLMEQLGEGGMGVVYVAEQTHPVRRRVALKIIKPGMDTRQVVGRFEAERQALALMDHPNIAKVHDGGTTELGRPYFVMELVRGLPITEFCDQEKLPIRERLELFVLVCRAVQHAHQKGVIHRDLKPSNILVTLHDGVPVPKVIDFGVAKATGQSLTDRTVDTGFHLFLGTPLYMSPEQAELSGLDVDTRSDIYSLGVLLYELLTGTTPFDSETLREAALDELRRMIRDEEHPSPSTRLISLGESLTTTSIDRSSDPRQLTRAVRGELDWIAMKALEKDRNRRFETANDFAADVMRYLADQPVLSCPPSASYRLRKFARRNQASLATAALVALSLLVGTAVSIWQAVRATHAEAQADSQRDRAERNANEAVRQRDETQRQKLVIVAREATLRRYLYAADMRLAWQAWSNVSSENDLNQVRRLLARHETEANGEDARSFAWYYLNGLCGQTPSSNLIGHEGRVYHLAISPDAKILASASQDGTARIWDLRTSRLRHILRGHAGEVNCVAFAPNGMELATASDDRTVRFWDPLSGREHSARALTGFGLPVHRVEFSADGKLLVTGEISEQSKLAITTLWDVSSLRKRFRKEDLYPLALSPVANRMAATSWDKSLRLWDVPDGKEREPLRGHEEYLIAGAFSPDGETVATGSYDGIVRLWGFKGQQIGLARWPGSVQSVAYSPDGRLLAAGYETGAIYLWGASDGRLTSSFGGHALRVRAVRFTPDGRTLASAGDDKTIKLWKLTAASLARQPDSQSEPFTALSFSPDGELLATSIGAKRSMLWTVRTGETRAVMGNGGDRDVTSAAFSPAPASRILATTGPGQSVSLVDLSTGSQQLAIAGPGPSNGSLTFSPDGETLVGDGNDGVIRVWDTRTGKELYALAQTGHIPFPRSVAISPDSRVLALQTRGQVACWDLATGVSRDLWTRNISGMSCLVYSPDGQTLATGAREQRQITLWDMSTGRERVILSGGGGAICSLAFSPDGRTLASGGDRGEVKLWDVATAQELISLVGHTGTVHFAAFSPDGDTLATAGSSADRQRGELRFWRTGTAESGKGKDGRRIVRSSENPAGGISRRTD